MAAPSLAGGRLFVTPLVGPLAGNDVFALASGKITIEDPKTPTHAVVKAIARRDIILICRVLTDSLMNCRA